MVLVTNIIIIVVYVALYKRILRSLILARNPVNPRWQENARVDVLSSDTDSRTPILFPVHI